MVLLLFWLISIIYCCDIPVIMGFEVFVNNHDSILYGIGLSICASYIFYVGPILTKKITCFRLKQNILRNKIYEIEESMTKVFSFLQGDVPSSEITISEDLIENYLNDINIFYERSKYEIQNHRELSVFEAVVYYDNKIISLIDEIFSSQYLEKKYEKILIKLKLSRIHFVFDQWKTKIPGEYEYYDIDSEEKIRTGYIWVNEKVLNFDIVSSIDEYLSIYNQIKKLRKKL